MNIFLKYPSYKSVGLQTKVNSYKMLACRSFLNLRELGIQNNIKAMCNFLVFAFFFSLKYGKFPHSRGNKTL